MAANKKIIIIAVILGLITVLALNAYIQSLDEPALASIPHTEVVVAVSTIPAHTRITEDMLGTKSIPSDAVHPEALTSLNDAVGGISRTEIIKDEQVLANRVFTDERRATLSYRVPEGMRAVSIPIGDYTGVAGYISPGDSIDILITFADEEVNEDLTTYTYFQNVKVLATGGETRERDTEEQSVVGTLTLLTTPEQAEALVYININTSLHITLRSPLDEEIIELDSYNFENFETFRAR